MDKNQLIKFIDTLDNLVSCEKNYSWCIKNYNKPIIYLYKDFMNIATSAVFKCKGCNSVAFCDNVKDIEFVWHDLYYTDINEKKI